MLPSILPSILPFWQDTEGWGQHFDGLPNQMIEALSVKQLVIPGRTFSRTFCPDAGAPRMTSLSEHFVRISQSIMGTDRRPAVAAADSLRHFSRQSVARANEWLCGIPTVSRQKCRDSAVAGVSRQISRHFGGIGFAAYLIANPLNGSSGAWAADFQGLPI